MNRKKKTDSQPDADFFRVAAWGKLGEICQKYLAKSRKVCVIGPVSVSTYQAQDGTTRANLEVYAEDVEFLSSANGQSTEGSAQPAESAGGFTAVEAGELPF